MNVKTTDENKRDTLPVDVRWKARRGKRVDSENQKGDRWNYIRFGRGEVVEREWEEEHGSRQKEREARAKRRRKFHRTPGEIKAASPVVREEQNSADSSTSCILVRHLPHLEHDSPSSEVASHFFLVCTLGYFIVHLTFVRGVNGKKKNKSQLSDGHLSPRHVQEERKSGFCERRRAVTRRLAMNGGKLASRPIDRSLDRLTATRRLTSKRALTYLSPPRSPRWTAKHGRFYTPDQLPFRSSHRAARLALCDSPSRVETTAFPVVLGKHFSEQPNRYHLDERKGGVIVSSRS
ncbi:hypothetical protein ALC57_06503 [Trachymyrmex cornetzi]|uniref:Uncharacterized protein n=1 Tax=Trachymyrmex cornetzi TaxID=471704 RepID=A0A151J8U9_9HYME|nr:hypothetical protein ALC57_06503 [Trachymyrmex cornetzi]